MPSPHQKLKMKEERRMVKARQKKIVALAKDTAQPRSTRGILARRALNAASMR